MNKFFLLKKRIKKNEGFKNKIYLDKLGYPTIGYGHLIKKTDNFLKNKTYSKNYLETVFEKDFRLALNEYKKHYSKKSYSSAKKEVLIEMIFQLGINGVLKFKKFNKYLSEERLYLAALEMKKSLWYLQTPKRVDGLIKILTGCGNVRKR